MQRILLFFIILIAAGHISYAQEAACLTRKTTIPQVASATSTSSSVYTTVVNYSGPGCLASIGYVAAGGGTIRITIDGGTPVSISIPNESFQTYYDATYGYSYGKIMLNSRFNTSLVVEIKKNWTPFVQCSVTYFKE